MTARIRRSCTGRPTQTFRYEPGGVGRRTALAEPRPWRWLVSVRVVNEPPTGLNTDELLAIVQRSWDRSVDTLTYLAVGFGAHHWQAQVGGEARYFVTLDDVGERHTLQTLQAAYAGASALARNGLNFVIAPIEPFVVSLAGRAVSVTPWVDGAPVSMIDKDATEAMLRRLHAVDPTALGVELPTWRPVVGPDLADQIASRLQRPWSDGPYGERSRVAVAAALGDIRRWVSRYAELGKVAATRDWVPTHGEPDWHNQLVTASGTALVDWETLKLAPVERDLQTLCSGDRVMLELFDLEWRLDEINQYTTWFSQPHGRSADDRIAFESFIDELTR